MGASPLQVPCLPLGECLTQLLTADTSLLDNPSKEEDLELILHSNQQAVISQPTVLAVDDDEDNLMLLSEVLKPISSSFITARQGRTALQLAKECQPALILLDVMLPDLSGIEVLQQLKRNLHTMTIPVIAVTALARAEDRDRLFLAGCDAYISKPYMLDDLEELIRRYLPQTPFAVT